MRIGTGLVSASNALTRTERLSYGPTGLLEQRTNDQAPTYPVADATGSLIAELAEQGPPEPLPELDPWGVPVQSEEPPASIADTKTFGFLGGAGRIEMPDSELTKLGARYYDAEVGAFLTVDPVVGEPAEPARRTPYIYGLSSPARFVDVDGRSAADAWKSAKKFVNEKASAVQERAAEITNDPNASWLSKASVVPIGLLSSLGTSENLADTLMAIAPIPGPGKLKGLGRVAEAVGGVVKGGRAISHGPVSEKVWKVLSNVDKTGRPLPGYKGGGVFRNDGPMASRLPSTGENGPIMYRKWDVNAHTKGVNRGRERLVTGSDGSAYYSADHFGTWVRIR